MLAFAVFFCLPPSSRSSSPIGQILRDGCHPIQSKILLWDNQIQSLKKQCNVFIPDFFDVHDMYLLVIGSYDHSRWFVCIFGREIQTSCYKCCLLRPVLVWTQMKHQQKQEVISDFSKKSKKYFNTREKINLTSCSKSFQRVKRGDPRKKSSKKDT